MPREYSEPVPEHEFSSLAAAKTALLSRKPQLVAFKQKIDDYIDRTDLSKYEIYRSAWVVLFKWCADRGIYWKDKRTIRVNVGGTIYFYTIQQIIDILT